MISDDDLLLYYYRDGLDAAERARIGTALAEQPELAQRLHRLVAQLDTAAEMPEVPGAGAHAAALASALERAARAGGRETCARRTRLSLDRRWLAAAAAVAVVALVSVIQVATRPPPAASRRSRAARRRRHADASAYERGLKWHLASTEQRLARLDSASPRSARV